MPNRNQDPVAFTLRPRFFKKRINTQGSVSRVLRTAKPGKIKKSLVPVEKAHQQAGYHPAKKAGDEADGQRRASQRRAVNNQLGIEQNRTHHKSGQKVVPHSHLGKGSRQRNGSIHAQR